MRIFALSAVCLCLLALAGPARAFDCAHVVFGTPLSEIDDGHFVPYREKDGVTYCNYTGACRLAIHDMANTAISFAFVDGRIYARIVRVFDGDLDRMLAVIQAKAGAPHKLAQEGDWEVYTWSFPGDVKSKAKMNRKTGEVRSAVYYEPLRAKLRGAPAEDPAEVPTN